MALWLPHVFCCRLLFFGHLGCPLESTFLVLAAVQIGEGAAHTEAAWAARLPRALRFLLQPWWADTAERNRDALFFTSPRKLQAGQPATLFVQADKSHVLAGVEGDLRVGLGFNNWTLGNAKLQLQPAPQLDQQAAGSPQATARWQAVSFTVPVEASATEKLQRCCQAVGTRILWVK